MLKIEHVTKRFPPLVAVNDVSFMVPPGAVLGLLGPNGAGKTTLFKLIAGFLHPDAGRIQFISQREIGFKPERLLFPNHLRVREYLEITAQLGNTDKANLRRVVAEALERVKLTGAAHKRIKECSKGMRQRLALAQVLIGTPNLLLMDEPFDGLDPEGQLDVCNLIQQLQQEGHTIILNSHQLHEVTEVCTHIVILNQGRIHYSNSRAEALAARPRVTIRATGDLMPIRDQLVPLHPQVQVEGQVVILGDQAIHLRRDVLRIILEAGMDIAQVEQQRPTLHEVYAEVVR